MKSLVQGTTCLFGALIMAATLAAACSNPGSGFTTVDGGTDDGSVNDDSGFNPNPDSGKKDAAPNPIGCDATCPPAGGTCVNNQCTIVANPGNVDPGTQTKLKAGGTADSAYKFLYPYDKTVFPRGLVSPTLQFAGTAWDAAYVHVSYNGFDYQGFYGPSANARLPFTLPVWQAITLGAAANSVVKVEVTKISGGNVTGPATESWTVAQGSIRGTIYYETFDSALAGGLGAVGIMKLPAGASQPVVLKSGCGNVCHTASADGSTLVAATGFGFQDPSAAYDLKNNMATINATGASIYVYGGLYPDGSLVMSATNYRTWISGASRLYNVKTGAAVAAPGWDTTITNAGTPAFSVDGKHVVFNHEDTGGGHRLAMMDFDVNTKTFSNLVDLYNDPSGYIGWPAFTPDAKSVIFHSGTSAGFETDSQTDSNTNITTNTTGNLYITDIATKTTKRLDSLDGYTGTGPQTYLPHNDPTYNFAPTVLPEAAGGYFWAVFTTHRGYGNMLPSLDANDTKGKLWVSAIDMNAPPGTDPSHPAFFVDGQELTAGNLRGFWVLDPCKSDGTDCKSGDECCNGFCRPSGNGLVCVPPPGGCSNEFEKCKTSADCCDSGFQCIAGKCALPSPN